MRAFSLILAAAAFVGINAQVRPPRPLCDCGLCLFVSMWEMEWLGPSLPTGPGRGGRQGKAARP